MNKLNLNDSSNSAVNMLDIDNINLCEERDEETKVYQKIKCVVKWFKQSEGYGFLKSDTLNREIFIHSSVLDPTELINISANDVLTCTVIEGVRGPQVDVVHSYQSRSAEDEQYYLGQIKWFDIKKDFGFIKPIEASQNKDIFLPGKKLRSIGLKTDEVLTDKKLEFTFKKDQNENYIVIKLKKPDNGQGEDYTKKPQFNQNDNYFVKHKK